MNQEIILANFNEELKVATKSTDLQALKIKYLGRKGIVNTLMAKIAQTKENKKEYGQAVNSLKEEIEKTLQGAIIGFREREIKAQMGANPLDISSDAVTFNQGSLHPLTIITNDIIEALQPLGFTVQIGEEIVSVSHNFEKLNILADHPAREFNDSFYIDGHNLLRTHTSAIDSTFLEQFPEQSIKILCPGRVYRRDDDDATHSHQFMQLDGVYLDTQVNMSDLKATLLVIVKALFGDKQEIKLRPSYFPFTEPSVEVDLACVHCQKQGCGVCKQSG